MITVFVLWPYLAGNKHPVQVPFRRFLHRKLADNVCRVASSA